MLLSALLLSLAISGRCHAHRKTRGKKKVIGQTIFFFSFLSFLCPQNNQTIFFFFKFWHYSGFHGEKKDGKKIHRLSLSQIRGRQFPVVRNDVLRNVFLLPKASLGDEAADGRKNVSGK
uniref:Putative secreted protein n=1 Tax=Ixodes ricinus TaxID=34613 RepID=A0A6B0UML0_IXORI